MPRNESLQNGGHYAKQAILFPSILFYRRDYMGAVSKHACQASRCPTSALLHAQYSTLNKYFIHFSPRFQGIQDGNSSLSSISSEQPWETEYESDQLKVEFMVQLKFECKSFSLNFVS